MYHMVGIDILLGMEWLSKNHAILDCDKKKVYLARDLVSGQKLFFRDEPIENQPLFVSYTKATKYLLKECQGFLAGVVDRQRSLRRKSHPLSGLCQNSTYFSRGITKITGDYSYIKGTLQNGTDRTSRTQSIAERLIGQGFHAN